MTALGAPAGERTRARFVHAFAEGAPDDRMNLGGKGANLCAMTQMGIDVPPGFVIGATACLAYLEADRLPPDWPKKSAPTSQTSSAAPARALATRATLCSSRCGRVPRCRCRG